MSFKKLISIFLALTFLAAALPLGASAEGAGISSVEVDDFEVVEHSHGWHVESTLDGATDSTEWFEYNIEPDEITVNFTDGTSRTDAPQKFRDEGYDVAFIPDEAQSDRTPWGVGEHTVTARINGVSTTYTITVTETPVASVIAVGRSYREDTNCYPYSVIGIDGEVEEEFIWYDDFPETVTIIYKDDTALTCSPHELEELTGYEGYSSSGQTKNHWVGTGRHTVVFEYLGVYCTFEIEITESPYDHISVDRMEIVEGTNQYPDTVDGVKFKRYDCSPDRVNVFMKDGTKIVMDYQQQQDEFGESGVFSDDQAPDNVWGVGVHTAHYRLGGMECDYEVEILPGPVVSITAVDFVCIEGLDGQTDYDFDRETLESHTWFRYMYNNTVVTVTLRDGTEITTRNCGFEYEGEYYSIECVDDQSYDNQWQVGGEYTGTLSVCGKSCTLTVWIDPNPIDRIEVDPIVLTENVDGYLYTPYDYETGEYGEPYVRYDYYPEYTVYFTDGTSVHSDRGWVDLFGTDYCINYRDDQDEQPWGVGDHEVQMSLAGNMTTATVTVVPDDLESVSISGTGELFVTLNHTNNTSETLRAESIELNGGGEGYINCKIETEEGRDLRATISYEVTGEGVRMYDSNVSVSLGSHKSNTLAKNTWFKNRFMMNEVLYCSFIAEGLLGFGGYEEGAEYDPAAIAMIATLSTVYGMRATDYSEDGMLCLAQYEPETVKAAVEYVFGISDFDASAIEYNDPSDPDHVWIRVPGVGLYLPGSTGSSRNEPNGWTFAFQPDDPDEVGYGLLRVVTDEDLTVKNISFDNRVVLTDIEISGDLTLEITATFSDGSIAYATATGIDVDDPAAYPLTGTLHTDAGDAEVEIKFDILRDGTHRFVGRNVSITIDGVTSNTLSSNAWIKSRLLGNSLPFVASIFKLVRPAWEGIDAESASANDLVEFATYCTGEFSNYEVNFANGKAYIKVPTDVARSIVYYVFGVDSLDLSKYSQIGTSGTSEYLDVELFDFDFADIPGGTTEIEYTDNPDFDMVGMEHNSDKWTVTFTVTDGDPGYDEIVVTADWQFNVEKIEFIGGPQHIPGDVDGNGGVNMKDILLLRRVLAGDVELSPEEQKNADVNGDGAVNMKDILLLRRIVAGDA